MARTAAQENRLDHWRNRARRGGRPRAAPVSCSTTPGGTTTATTRCTSSTSSTVSRRRATARQSGGHRAVGRQMVATRPGRTAVTSVRPCGSSRSAPTRQKAPRFWSHSWTPTERGARCAGAWARITTVRADAAGLAVCVADVRQSVRAPRHDRHLVDVGDRSRSWRPAPIRT
jgi:hypothetical protein